MVRQPLLWAGASDVAGVFRLNAEDSEELRAFRGLMWSLHQMFGDEEFSAARLAGAGYGVDPATIEALHEALDSLPIRDKANARSLGKVLKSKVGRVVTIDGKNLQLTSHADRTGTLRFRVTPVARA